MSSGGEAATSKAASGINIFDEENGGENNGKPKLASGIGVAIEK
jgi:hypothetical protein